MQFYKLAIGVTLTIAATVATQAAARSQPFKTPTHPTLPELATASSNQKPTLQPQATQSQAISVNSKTGKIFFQHPPSLIRVASSQQGGYVPSTYEFTLTVPADAGQPLKAVTIAQAPNLERIKFDVSQSKAFAGGRFATGPEIALASVGGEQPSNPGEVTVVFDQPVQPGSTVTVAVQAKSNPNFSGAYDFGVTAYPDGENGRGQFLGYGRINFYGNSN